MAFGSLRKGPAPALRARVQSRIETLEKRTLLSAGDLDTSWGGGDGIVYTDFSTPGTQRGELAFSVAVQADGRIVSAGTTTDYNVGQSIIAVSRHLPNGDIDPSFGGDGTVVTEVLPGLNTLGQYVAIDSQNRIVVAGRTGVPSQPNGDSLTLVRYNPNGTLDSNFGSGGKAVYTQFVVSEFNLLIDNADRILIGFTVGEPGNPLRSDFAVARINVNGFVDGSFGTFNTGVTAIDVGIHDIAGGLALTADGHIIQAGIVANSLSPNGNAIGNLTTIRYTANGALDTGGYGNGAVFQSSLRMDRVKSVFLDLDGSLVAAGVEFYSVDGFDRGKLTLARVADDGSSLVDYIATSYSNDSLQWSIAPQRDGKILVAGDDISGSRYFLARFDGQFFPDAPFGDGDGTVDIAYISPSADYASATAVVSDSEGQILVAGFGFGPNDADFLLTRHDAAIAPGAPAIFADANARPNDEPYVVNEGQLLTLSGAGSYTVGGASGVVFNQSQRRVDPAVGGGSGAPVYLDWDLDNDGEFDDLRGENPQINAGALNGPGTLTVRLRVSDASNPAIFADDSAVVTINNVAPSAQIVLPATAVEGETVTISATASDPGPDTLHYNWTVTRGADVLVDINNSLSNSFPFTPPDNGAYLVALTVTDGDGGSVTPTAQTLNVTNKAPTVTTEGGGVTVDEGTEVGFTATGHDVLADEPTLTYQWTVTKDNQAYNASGTGQSFAFTPDDNGVYRATVVVTDKDGGAVTDTLPAVTAENVAPTPNITGDVLGVRAQERTINLAATDPGAADVEAGFTFTVDWADGSPVETFAPGTATATHTFAENGIYAVQITAEDQDAAVSEVFTFSMLTQSATIENGILYISGGTGDNKIRVFRSGSEVVVGISDVPGGGAEFFQSYSDTINRVVIVTQGGNDKIDASAMNIPVEVYAGAGDDKIDTGSGADIVVAGDGDDDIKGGGGSRDILIGGRGRDNIQGDNGDDIIVGGYTLHDGDILALRAISAEWNSSRTYLERIDNIRGTTTGGFNGTYYLRANFTTFDDLASDKLSGGNGRDWFFFNNDKSTGKDKILDAAGNEILDEVGPQP